MVKPTNLSNFLLSVFHLLQEKMTFSKSLPPHPTPWDFPLGIATLPGVSIPQYKFRLSLASNCMTLNLQGGIDSGALHTRAKKSVLTLLCVEIFQTPHYEYGFIQIRRGRKKIVEKVICSDDLPQRIVLGVRAMIKLLTPTESLYHNVLPLA